MPGIGYSFGAIGAIKEIKTPVEEAACGDWAAVALILNLHQRRRSTAPPPPPTRAVAEPSADERSVD